MPNATRTRIPHTARRPGPDRPTILRVEGLVARAPDGTVLLDEVSFAVPTGSVVAVVGPTGSGKTTLLNALTGMNGVEAGRVLLDGVDLIAGDEQARRRIGYVPQEDALHGQLDVQRTLQYSATLRLPPSVDDTQRSLRVARVLSELGLGQQAHLPVASLSGGQRKRASVAVELLAEPDVLILDEPTSGLDPGYEKALLQTLRDVADRGRTVLTVTHSLQALALCDLALFIAPGGRVAFYGPPAEALKYFGSSDAADVFLVLDTEHSLEWKERFRGHPAYARYVDTPTLAPPPRAALLAERSWFSQFAVLARRYIDLIRADRRQLLMLSLQGPVLGVLLLAVLAPHALRHAAPSPEAVTVAVFTTISATWLGAANAVREVVKEQRITRRERGGGLSVSAYVASKVAVLGTLTMVQCVLFAAIAISRQHPAAHAAVLPNAMLEMMVTVALTGLAAVAFGLLLSAAVDTPDKALSLLPIVLVAQLVLSGGWASVLRTPGLHQLADLTVARWGVQAFEATGRADGHAWLASMAALAGITVTSLIATSLLVRARMAPKTSQSEGVTRSMAILPLCALVCTAGVLALGSRPVVSAAHVSPRMAVHAPVRAAKPTTMSRPRPAQAVAAPTSAPTTTPKASAARRAVTVVASGPKVALPAVTVPQVTVPQLSLPPVVVPVVTVPPVTVPVTVPAVVPAMSGTAASPASTSPASLASLAAIAMQMWAASHPQH